MRRYDDSSLSKISNLVYFISWNNFKYVTWSWRVTWKLLTGGSSPSAVLNLLKTKLQRLRAHCCKLTQTQRTISVRRHAMKSWFASDYFIDTINEGKLYVIKRVSSEKLECTRANSGFLLPNEIWDFAYVFSVGNCCPTSWKMAPNKLKNSALLARPI